MYGAIEAGGTKFVCAVGNDRFEVIEKVTFPTTTPDETFRQVFGFFDRFRLEAIGIGSFGPIDVNRKSATYGYILNTPKKAWINTDFVGRIKEKYAVPIGWTTDVNMAALAEAEKGAGVGLDSVLYLTVGTGIGGGAVVRGRMLEGYSHPEMGHVLVRRHPEDSFAGLCPSHGDCLEGLAAGPTIEARLGRKGSELDPNHPVWDFVAYYLSQALHIYTMTLRPDVMVLGGGVMKVPGLLDKIKTGLAELLAGYVDIPPIDRYVVKPGLGEDVGVVGGFLLAAKALSLPESHDPGEV